MTKYFAHRGMIFISSVTSLFLAGITPTYGWEVNLNAAQKRVEIITTAQDPGGAQIYSFMAPTDTVAVASDDDTLYVLRGQAMVLIPVHELAALDPGSGLISTGVIDIRSELGERKALGLSALGIGGATSLVLTLEGKTPGRVELRQYIFYKKRSVDMAEKEGGPAPGTDIEEEEPNDNPASQSFDAINIDENKRFLMALRSEPREILGSGLIAMVRNPRTLAPSILSLDREHGLLHRYDLNNLFVPEFARSYDIGALEKGLEKDQLLLSNKNGFRGEVVLRDQGLELSLSILELDAQLAGKRAAILGSFHEESIGNEWTKQLMGWGALSSMVDAIDVTLDTKNTDVEALTDDPNIKRILSLNSPNAVIALAETSGLFTSSELDQMKKEQSLRGSRGRRWFVITAIAAGFFTYTKLRSTPFLLKERRAVEEKIKAFLGNTLARLGVSSRRVSNFLHASDVLQRRFRGYLIRNAQDVRRQAYLIPQLEKKIVRLADEINTLDASLVREAKASGRLSSRADAILKTIKEIELLDATGKLQQLKPHVSLSDWLSQLFKKNPDRLNFAQKILRDGHKLKIQEELFQVDDALRRLKARMLNTIQDAEKNNGFKHGVGTEASTITILNINNPEMLRALAQKALAALKHSGKHKPRHDVLFNDNLEALMKRHADLHAIVDSWTVKGKVHWTFDVWAQVAGWHARYFLPESVFNLPGLRSNFFKRNFRNDLVTTSEGVAEKIQISGENARRAVSIGAFDVGGDFISQALARQSLSDPEERIWGHGDNFIEFVPWGENSYGVHFDLIASELENIWGWAMSMPLSFASIGMNYGSNGQISYLRRLWDRQKKSILLTPWTIANTYPFWWLSQNLVMGDYQKDHADELNSKDPYIRLQAEEKKAAFASKMQKRNTSLSVVGERILFNKAVGVPYINPQYLIQDEFEKAAHLITRGNLVGRFVSSAVMPQTTGYYLHKWWGEYFGFNNPTMAALLKEFKIEGLLAKIDERGEPRLSDWTSYEQTMFFYLVSILEMQRQQELVPLAVGADEKELAAWFEKVYAIITAQDGPVHDLVPPNEDDYIHKRQAEALLAMLKKLRRGFARFPLIQKNEQQHTLAVNKIDAAAAIERDRERQIAMMQHSLKDLESLNRNILHVMNLIRKNEDVMGSMDQKTFYLTLADTILLGDAFWAGGRIPAALGALTGRWRGATQAIVKKIGAGAMLAQIPFYFWAGDQAEAHVYQGKSLNELLMELHSILLAGTEALSVELIKTSLRADTAQIGKLMLAETKTALTQTKDQIGKILFESQLDTKNLLELRRYRWNGILSEYAPLGIGAGLGWMGFRSTLFRASKGIFTRMTDPFAKRLTQASFLLWIMTSHGASAHERHVSLNANDFLVLYQMYYSLSVELNMINQMEDAQTKGHDLRPHLIAEKAEAAAQNDTLLTDATALRAKLLKLVE